MESLRETIQNLFGDRLNVLTSSTLAVLSALLVYLYARKRKTPAISFPVSVNNQSIEIQPGVRGSALNKDGKLLEGFFEDVTTTFEAMQRGLRVSNNGPMLGTIKDGKYMWKSYQQIYDAARCLGSALMEKGLSPGEDTLVGIYASNREEWTMSDIALAMFSMVSVPLYDTLGPEACVFIMKQTEMAVVICDNDAKVGKMLQSAQEMPSLKCIVVMDEVSNNNLDSAQKSNVEIITLAEMLKLGEQHLREPVPPKSEDLATVCYTSGTTGNPKGVMLTHKALISNSGAILMGAPEPVTHKDVYISYLPLAHMFERTAQVFIIQCGASIGFFGGNTLKLIDDMALLKPTLFNTVPRLLNRIYDKVLLKTEGKLLARYLFNKALEKKSAMLQRGEITRSSIWDMLVFGKIQKMLGGRVKFVVVGSAPLSAAVMDFTRAAFGCYVMEGYGQTECVAGCCITLPNDLSLGHVGPPVPCNMCKLVDVPEMDYWVKDNKGELCMKGNNLMRGYFKEPEKTREAIDEDGWLHSGDIGQWLPSGTMKIIDRRKHIFKLAQGEYVAPEKIENIYNRSAFVSQVFVDGDGLQTFTVAIIVPDPDYVVTWAKKKNIPGTMEELCTNEVVVKAVLEDITKVGKGAGLKGFEQVKVIRLHSEPFSIENNLLTPTLKSKRPVLRKFFSQHIKEMYGEN